MLRLAEFAIGIMITLNTLVDVFSSIVVPGPSTAGLSVARHVRRITVPLWRYVSQKGKGPRRQLSNSLAPVLFFLAFATWMALLLVGFSLMFDALAVAFEPPLAGFDEAIYFAITVCALFNFYNRWIDASGVHALSDEAHREGGKRMATHGYARS